MSDAITNTGLVAVSESEAANLARLQKVAIAKARVVYINSEAERMVENHRHSWLRRLFREPVKTVDDVLDEWKKRDKHAGPFTCSPLITSGSLYYRTEALCNEVLRLSAAASQLSVVYLSPCQLEAIHPDGWAVGP